MIQLTDVVKNLLIINVLMFIGTQMSLGDPGVGAMNELINLAADGGSGPFMRWERYILALFAPTSPYFQPYQIVTHMFMHADLGHLFFNMFGLYMFGPALEHLWGAKKFLFYYFFAGFGAMILHVLVTYLGIAYFGEASWGIHVPMLGASGAIFGLLAGYGLNFPEQRVMLLIPPIPMKAKYFVLIFAAIELFAGLSPINTGVAHFAHLGGGLFGFLLIRFGSRFSSRW